MKKFALPIALIAVLLVVGIAFAQGDVNVQLPSEQLGDFLILAGLPLGAVIFAIIELLKVLGGYVGTNFFKKQAVLLNLILSLSAYGVVFVWQLGYIPVSTVQTLVAIGTFLTTFASAAGVYDLTVTSGIFPARRL